MLDPPPPVPAERRRRDKSERVQFDCWAGEAALPLHFLSVCRMGRSAALTLVKRELLELVAFLDDLGRPARVPSDQSGIAVNLPGPSQAFIGPTALGFSIG